MILKKVREKRKIFKYKLLPEETKETNIDLKQPIEKKEKNEKNKRFMGKKRFGRI